MLYSFSWIIVRLSQFECGFILGPLPCLTLLHSPSIFRLSFSAAHFSLLSPGGLLGQFLSIPRCQQNYHFLTATILHPQGRSEPPLVQFHSLLDCTFVGFVMLYKLTLWIVACFLFCIVVYQLLGTMSCTFNETLLNEWKVNNRSRGKVTRKENIFLELS